MKVMPEKILAQVFGYSHFRGQQQAIIDHVIQGKDALVIMPTGAGKSLCYQIPAIVRDGMAIVISPLIALMEDQVMQLQHQGVSAACLNSNLDEDATRNVYRQAFDNQLDLLYLSPERLQTEGVKRLLATATIGLLAIDEAHCVSQWGHDFRPEYREISKIREYLPNVPCIALTATADSQTREDIRCSLYLEKAQLFLSGFDRPNIHYAVALKKNAKQQLLHFIQNEHPNDSGIVYCMTRKKVDELAEFLSEKGLQALPYHAGLAQSTRQKNQYRFINEERLVIVATVAFGMGINKPNVRYVAHFDMPKSIEAYYQETGRAGRDGLPANAWMVYGLNDVILMSRIMQSNMGAAKSAKHAQVEKNKLELMLAFCEAHECRRKVLLHYFGETLKQPCGHCDNCKQSQPTWNATLQAQKALSNVFRTGQQFGVKHLIDVLRGKLTTKIRSLHHDKLSTFGIGTELDETGWRSVYRQLLAHGYMTVDFERHGAFKLHDTCRPLLRGEKQITLKKENHQNKFSNLPKLAIPLEMSERQALLFEELKGLRHELAKENGVPAYMVFNDKALTHIIQFQPQNLYELSKLAGFGKNKLNKYGSRILEFVNSKILD